jgi:hypothetical protein
MLHVRFGSLADISERTRDVRFTSESGHLSVSIVLRPFAPMTSRRSDGGTDSDVRFGSE